MKRVFHRVHGSPVGPLVLAVTDDGVHAIEFHASRHPAKRDARWHDEVATCAGEVVLPCHRVIGADGALTGFGGGLPTKRFLLELEGALPRAAEELFGLR